MNGDNFTQARFLSRDSALFSAGANLYAFCAADPVNHFDPTGCVSEDNEAGFGDRQDSLEDVTI